MVLICINLCILIYIVLTSYIINKLKTAQLTQNSLTHEEIKEVRLKLGYRKTDGVCYGFTLNWAQDVAQGRGEHFYQKLSSIRLHRTDLASALKGISFKEASHQRLSTAEQVTKSLPDLFEKISIAQDPTRYREQYGALIRQPDVNSILSQINSGPSAAKQVFYKTHSFADKSEAIKYFDFLRSLGLKEHVAVVICTAKHAMGFKILGDQWLFIDINKLYIQYKNIPYYKVTTKELVDVLYDSCFFKTSQNRLTVNTDFISAQNESYLVHGLRNAFPAFPLSSKIPYPDKIELLKLATTRGDMVTAKKCLNARLSVFSKKPLNDKSPIAIAIFLDRRDVFSAMLHSSPKNLNRARKSDGATMLHLACQKGGIGIVEELMRYKSLIIDAQDFDGMTPLMHACRLSIYTNDAYLIQLLLDRNASLTTRDNIGFTALEHAQVTKHKIAEELICKQLNSQKLPKPSSQASRGSLSFFNAQVEEQQNTASLLARNF